MVTFGELESSTVVKMLAAGSLSQLYRNATMARMGVTDAEGDAFNKYFELGDTITVSRPKLSAAAQDFDPRAGSDATSAEPGYVNISLALEKLYTQGYKIYSNDAQVERYIRNYSQSVGGAIRKSVDDYLYLTWFRNWSLAASGTLDIANHPPLQVVWRESSNALTGFSDTLLIDAGTTLSRNEVPDTGRYARLSHVAYGSYTKDITPVQSASIASLNNSAMAESMFINGSGYQEMSLRGFMCSPSNAVTSQAAVADTGDGNASETIGAIVADTTVFFDGDESVSTPLGAVRLTITQTANLAAGVAVGKIVRIAATGGAAKAYGVILRVDAANKYVWLVPYDAAGNKMVAAQFTGASDTFSIPAIGSINVGAHQEHCIYATRLLSVPPDGSGAVAEAAVDANSGLVMQTFQGGYEVNRFRANLRSACLIGAKPSDHRKSVLMLSA